MMIKIGLFCAAGFSTGMLVNNMKIAAEKRNLEVEVEAYPQAKLCDCVEEMDVALLGPQVSYTFDESEAICKDCDVPLAVIPMQDYGIFDGDKVLNLALSISKKKVSVTGGE
ncbi:PTS sugar transporter subunit IIB [Amphibacillus sp. Q70]|uniref:PTS sugar transporter subunit IIB n=1 Tax=Amphibacillus sp. Q70 TaxID=3453416 RepID=UPI003F8406BE